jgi:hypothetical protein
MTGNSGRVVTNGSAPVSRERLVALGLMAVAVALRLAHLLTVQDAPFFSILYIDPLMYDEWGLRIASGQLFSERPFFLDPLYPYFLGLIYATLGHHYVAVVAVQSLLGALGPPLVFFSTRRGCALPTATAAGAIAAIYVPAIYFGGLIMKPALAMFLVAVWLWLFSRCLRETRHWPEWFAAGVVFGLACLTRGNLLLVTPVLALWLLLRDARGRGAMRLVPERRRFVESGAWVAGLALVLAIPAAHNVAVGGEFILTTANAGANFYIGNNPSNETGQYQQLPFIRGNPKYEQLDFAREAQRRGGQALTDRELSAFWFGESWSWVREEPRAWLRLLWSKLRAFWGAYEIPDSLDYHLYREFAPVLRLPVPGFGLLAPLALLGAMLALRRPGWPRLLLLLVGAYCLSIVTFFVFSRFRMVAVFALYVLAAHAGVELVRRWRAAVRGGAETWRPALIAAGLFLLFWVFVNVPVRARTDGWSFRLASVFGLPTRGETSMMGRHNLGVAYARKAKEVTSSGEEAGWLASAEAELRRALELQGQTTETARIHVELGKVLARQERNRDAIAVYREAGRIEPGDFQIHHALGILHYREGEREQAAEAFLEALKLAPRHVLSAGGSGAGFRARPADLPGQRPSAARARRGACALGS